MPASFSTPAIGTATSSTADTAIVAAPGAKNFINLDSLVISNTSASPSSVTIKQGSTAILGPFYVAAQSTISPVLGKRIRLSENTALNFASSASVASIVVSVGYHLDPES